MEAAQVTEERMACDLDTLARVYPFCSPPESRTGPQTHGYRKIYAQGVLLCALRDAGFSLRQCGVLLNRQFSYLSRLESRTRLRLSELSAIGKGGADE